jgi:hypothetical protein
MEMTKEAILARYAELQKDQQEARAAEAARMKAWDATLVERAKQKLPALNNVLVEVIARLMDAEANPRWRGKLEYSTIVKGEHFPEYVEKKWVTDYFEEKIWEFLLNRGKDNGWTEEQTRKRYQVWATTPSYHNMVVTINNFHASAELEKLLAQEQTERTQQEQESWRARREEEERKEEGQKRNDSMKEMMLFS